MSSDRLSNALSRLTAVAGAVESLKHAAKGDQAAPAAPAPRGDALTPDAEALAARTVSLLRSPAGAILPQSARDVIADLSGLVLRLAARVDSLP